jgi:hypothetical protein
MDGTSKTKEKKFDLETALSQQQQSPNCGLGLHLHNRHAPILSAIKSRHQLTQLTQHATQISKAKYTFHDAKGQSGQP